MIDMNDFTMSLKPRPWVVSVYDKRTLCLRLIRVTCQKDQVNLVSILENKFKFANVILPDLLFQDVLQVNTEICEKVVEVSGRNLFIPIREALARKIRESRSIQGPIECIELYQFQQLMKRLKFSASLEPIPIRTLHAKLADILPSAVLALDSRAFVRLLEEHCIPVLPGDRVCMQVVHSDSELDQIWLSERLGTHNTDLYMYMLRSEPAITGIHLAVDTPWNVSTKCFDLVDLKDGRKTYELPKYSSFLDALGEVWHAT
jgi:hypothetical protein